MSKDLHDEIMNLPCERTMSHFVTQVEMRSYKEGHRDARHAAAELALSYTAGAAKGGITSDESIGLIDSYLEAQSTQAAANKAAEEGGLPALPETEKMFGQVFNSVQMREYARQAIAADRASRQVAEKVTCGFCKGTGDGEIGLHGCTDCNGKGYFWEPIEDEVASRQVANKAEVEPVAYLKRFSDTYEDMGGNTVVDSGLEVCDRGEEGTFPVYVTPPATTGASTVLTDERIDAIWDKTPGIGLTHRYAFAREVAAQAGQVAVPEVVREAVEAAFEDREGWRTKIAAAVRSLPAKESK